MKLPLENRLRKRLHREVGRLQDEVVELLYAQDSRFVLHGGTALWRCYGGGRFSEDIDLYFPSKWTAALEEKIRAAVSARGLELLKLKDTGNTVFAKIAGTDAEIRVEISHGRKAGGEAVPFEKMDGTTMIVLALSGKALLLEKAAAYASRRLVRDLYDVFFLAAQVEADDDVRKAISAVVREFRKPLDEGNLEAIVLSGAVPSVEQMVSYLKAVR